MSQPEAMRHDHLGDEELIEIALATSAGPGAVAAAESPAASVADCARCASRLEEWRAFLYSVRARSSADGLESGASIELAEHVLARTTRARDTASRATPWLRIAAAALLLLAPVLALAATDGRWRVWLSGILPGVSQTERDLVAGTPDEPDEPDQHRGATRVADGPADDRAADASREPHAASSVVEEERSILGRFDDPARDDSARTAVGRMLQVRGQWLGSREPLVLGDESSTATLSRALAWDAAVRALCCEHLLDRYLLEGRVPEDLEHAVEVLLDARTSSGAERRLELAALSRAREYGLLDATQRAELDRALARAGVDARDEPLFSGEPRDGAPIDVAWLGALEAALDGSERGDPVVCAWLAAR